MCPIWPLHLIVLYVLALCPLWVICQNVPRLTAVFSPPSIIVKMEEYKYVDVSIEGAIGLRLEPSELGLTSYYLDAVSVRQLRLVLSGATSGAIHRFEEREIL